MEAYAQHSTDFDHLIRTARLAWRDVLDPKLPSRFAASLVRIALAEHEGDKEEAAKLREAFREHFHEYLSAVADNPARTTAKRKEAALAAEEARDLADSLRKLQAHSLGELGLADRTPAILDQYAPAYDPPTSWHTRNDASAQTLRRRTSSSSSRSGRTERALGKGTAAGGEGSFRRARLYFGRRY
ncbi:hypothetical protein JCM10450v2_008158 [Rhodotorula kratochvilovae]